MLAQKDEKLTEDKRTSVAEPLAADSVKQLTAAWEKGYLRRNSGGFGSLFSSSPTLKDVQSASEFTVVRDREDFRQLVERIRTESPPKPASSTKENAPATDASK